jgi:hypothetical protein
VATFLLSKGTQADYVADEEKTPLIYASDGVHNHRGVVPLLLHHMEGQGLHGMNEDVMMTLDYRCVLGP